MKGNKLKSIRSRYALRKELKKKPAKGDPKKLYLG